MNDNTKDIALETALLVAGFGAPVFPIRAGTKTDALVKWGSQASTDPDVIRSWAQWHPGCNWGMVCTKIRVFDADNHGDGINGLETLAAFEAEHGKLETWAVYTPRGGGRQFYFNASKADIRVLDRDGCELRGDAHMVVLPGSVTPHGTYRFDPDLNPETVPLALLPDHLVEFFRGTKPNGKANGKANGAGPEEKRDPRKTALDQWFETEVHQPHRHHALCHGVGLMAAAGMPWPATDAAARWWCEHRCLPAILDGSEDMARAAKSIRGVWEKESLKRHTAADDAEDSGLTIHAVHGFNGLVLPKRQHVLIPVIPEKGLVMLYAYRGVGKTYVGLGMAWAIATGQGFLSWKAGRAHKVIYVDGEMPAQELQDRLKRLAAANPDNQPGPDYLRILSMDLQETRTLNLANELDQAAVEKVLGDTEVIVFDNRSTLVYSGRENDAESWDIMQQWFLKLRRLGKTAILVDHASRGGTARGTSKREDVLDTIIHLKRPDDYEPEQGARFEVHLHKARGVFGDDAQPFEAQLETRDGADYWIVKSMADMREAQVAALMDEGRTEREISEELGIPKTTVHRIITRIKAKRSAQ